MRNCANNRVHGYEGRVPIGNVGPDEKGKRSVPAREEEEVAGGT